MEHNFFWFALGGCFCLLLVGIRDKRPLQIIVNVFGVAFYAALLAR